MHPSAHHSRPRCPSRSRSALPLLLALVATAPLPAPAPVAAQDMEMRAAHPRSRVTKANWELAARFAPYRMRKLVFSTSVSPNWIKHGDRFWYEWKTSDGSFFYIVDPAKGTKKQIFDRDRIAAELTRITKDPWDAKHLPIRNIRFIDENTLQFEVESSQEEVVEKVETEEEQQEQMKREERRKARARKKKKVFHFEYDLRTRTLRELKDWEAPDKHPRWASLSPDSAWVVFTRECNLYLMSGEDYWKIVDARRGKTGEEADSAEAKVEVEEIQLTTDGEKWYCYGSYGRGETDEETEKNWTKRQPSGVLWSHDSRYFALTRQDRRKVGELWVVHVVGNKRPQLETYKYDMPGEEDVTQTELLVFDMQAREMKKIDDDP